MMPRNILRAFVPCLFLAVAPMLMQCGGAAGIGTETGNPPGIVHQKLYLQGTSEGVEVVGSPGAISPAGAAVRVTNVRTSMSVEASAGPDGSLDVAIAGAPGDEYEVTVSSGGQQATEQISFARIAERSDLGDLSCEALESTLNGTLSDVFAGADAACVATSDCQFASWSTGTECFVGCVESPLSQAGARDVQALGVQRTGPVCAALAACQRPEPPPCAGLAPFADFILCREGRCQQPDPRTLLCGDFLDLASDRRTRLRAEADRTCSVDADCGLASVGARCLADCDGAVEGVSLTAVPTLEAEILAEVDAAICQPALDRGCTAPLVDCGLLPGPPQAFCDAGACAVRYVE